MIRVAVRTTVGLAGALAAFALCLWLLVASGMDRDTAIIWSMLAAMPWAWALGMWAGAPRIVRVVGFIAPISAQIPTSIQEKR